MGEFSDSQDSLLQPLELGHLKLRNRIMSTSHACGLEEGGMPLDRYQAYHEEKARGGIALTMFGGSSNVAIDSPSVFQQLNVGVDDVIPHLERLSQRVHARGAAIMCQITHLGRRGESYKGAMLPTVAPSTVRETLHRSIPKEMDGHDIRRIVRAYADAAARCKAGGLDGIECVGSAHLIGQFLSPATNRRTDGYGGSLANRCRFGLEVYEAIKERVGSEFLLGLRLVVDEGYEDGLGFEQCLEIAHLFEQSGHLDFFNALYGRMDTSAGLALENMPGMASPIGPWLERAAQFKRAVGLPVFHAARITDVATARYAISEGLIDMVGMTRAHIADPHLVAKIAAGEEARIRPCVGATHCMSELRPTCLHNPASGREGVLHHQVARAGRERRVVVVGAGPAGLEAARVCALRGHDVVVMEAGVRPGGQVLLAAQASWRKDIIGVVDWRVAELERMGCDIRCNTLADAPGIIAESPDLVVVATGGVPNLEWLEGAELVTSAWDVLSGNAALSEDVLVIDGTGRHVALSAAEYAHRHGAKVRLAIIDEMIAAEQTYAERLVWRRWIHAERIPVSQELLLTAVRPEGNKIEAVFRDEVTDDLVEISADQVIYDYGTIPAADVYFELVPSARNDGVTDLELLSSGAPQPQSIRASAAEGFELHRIGDAVSSRNIHAAVLDALRLCQNA